MFHAIFESMFYHTYLILANIRSIGTTQACKLVMYDCKKYQINDSIVVFVL